MSVILGQKVIDALVPLVGDTKRVRRVVIDIQVNEPVVIHVEKYGDSSVIDVVRALEGVEIVRSSGGDD